MYGCFAYVHVCELCSCLVLSEVRIVCQIALYRVMSFNVGAGNQTWEEQLVLLTTEPSLHSPSSVS